MDNEDRQMRRMRIGGQVMEEDRRKGSQRMRRKGE